MGDRMSPEFPGLPNLLVEECRNEWYYPRPVPTGPMPDRLQRVLRVVEQHALVEAEKRQAGQVGPEPCH